jgi:hypothetical protein
MARLNCKNLKCVLYSHCCYLECKGEQQMYRTANILTYHCHLPWSIYPVRDREKVLVRKEVF